MSSVAPQRWEILQTNVNYKISMVCYCIISGLFSFKCQWKAPWQSRELPCLCIFYFKSIPKYWCYHHRGYLNFFIIILSSFFFLIFPFFFFPERGLIFAKFYFSLTPCKSFVAFQSNNRQKCKPKWNKWNFSEFFHKQKIR